MAVAFDAGSESHTGTTGHSGSLSFSWTHTPVGTPRGVLVFNFSGTGIDKIDTIDYGGTAMDEITEAFATDTAGVVGRVDVFFLGASVPTGAQTVLVTRNNSSNSMYAVAISFTANADTEVYIPGIVLLQEDGTLAEQNVDDGSPGSDSLRAAGLHSGLDAVPSAGANSTAVHSIDLGTQIWAVVVETVAGQGSRPVGFSSGSSDSRAASHLAVREVIAGTPVEFARVHSSNLRW